MKHGIFVEEEHLATLVFLARLGLYGSKGYCSEQEYRERELRLEKYEKELNDRREGRAIKARLEKMQQERNAATA